MVIRHLLIIRPKAILFILFCRKNCIMHNLFLSVVAYVAFFEPILESRLHFWHFWNYFWATNINSCPISWTWAAISKIPSNCTKVPKLHQSPEIAPVFRAGIVVQFGSDYCIRNINQCNLTSEGGTNVKARPLLVLKRSPISTRTTRGNKCKTPRESSVKFTTEITLDLSKSEFTTFAVNSYLNRNRSRRTKSFFWAQNHSRRTKFLRRIAL